MPNTTAYSFGDVVLVPVCEQRIGAMVESAFAKFGGNGGCLALQKLAVALVNTLEPIGSEPAAAEIRTVWSKAGDDLS